MTRLDVINHILHMHSHEPAYARKAHAWYAAVLEWVDLPSFDELIKSA